jgi:hypothetical protein
MVERNRRDGLLRAIAFFVATGDDSLDIFHLVNAISRRVRSASRTCLNI